MKTFATSRENTILTVDDEAITLIWKEYPVWEVKAEHIKRVLFDGSDSTMEVEVSVDGEELSHLIDLPKNSYEEAEILFTEYLDGVHVSSLSKKRQLVFPLSMMAFTLVVTTIIILSFIEINTAPDLNRANEPGMFRVLGDFLAEQFGTKGILILAGFILLVLGGIALKRAYFPKVASTVNFHYGDRMMIFRNEDAEDTEYDE